MLEVWSLPVLLACAYGVSWLHRLAPASRAFSAVRLAALVLALAAWAYTAPAVAVNGGRGFGWALVVVMLPSAALAGLVGLEVLRMLPATCAVRSGRF